MDLTERYANDLSGKHIVYFGWNQDWPGFLQPTGPVRHLKSRGAIIQEKIDKDTDYVVIGPGREKGKAEAPRKVEKLKAKGQAIEVLNPMEFLHLLRPDISGVNVAFTGGFSHGAADLDGGPAALLKQDGAIVHDSVCTELDYLVVGERRAKGKTADLRKVEKLNEEEGADIQLLHEQDYLDMLAMLKAPDDVVDFAGFVVQLRSVADPRRIDRAIKMLKKESYQIYSDVSGEMVSGIVKSQTSKDTTYAPWIKPDGSYGCSSWDDDFGLCGCMGLQGKVCKHLLVLLMGLTCNEEVDIPTALDWMTTAKTKRPSDNEDPSAQMFLRFKAVKSGEIDWRPTETVPEDYYVL